MNRVRLDAELGAVRYCPRCDEEWPLDAEFWHWRKASREGRGPIALCRCCLQENRRRSYVIHQEAERARHRTYHHTHRETERNRLSRYYQRRKAA